MPGSEHKTVATCTCTKLEMIPINAIDYNSEHPRFISDPEHLKFLVENIREKGLKEPIRVIEYIPSRYMVISGKRRLLAYIELKKDTIPAFVNPYGSGATEIDPISEEATTVRYSPIERAFFYQNLISKGKSRKEICQQYDLSLPTLSELLKICDIQIDVLCKCVFNEHTSKRFLTELSKFDRNKTENAYKYFLEKKKLPPRAKRGRRSKNTSQQDVEIAITALSNNIVKLITLRKTPEHYNFDQFVQQLDDMANEIRKIIFSFNNSTRRIIE